jgi:hypothetical protein
LLVELATRHCTPCVILAKDQTENSAGIRLPAHQGAADQGDDLVATSVEGGEGAQEGEPGGDDGQWYTAPG